LRRLRLSALLHVLPADLALRSVVELRLPNRLATGVAERVGAAACLSGRPEPGLPPGGAAVRRWVSGLGTEVAEDVLDLWGADARHQGPRGTRAQAAVRAMRRRVAAELARRPPLTIGDLALDGREVMRLTGLPGGPAVGEALRHLLDRVVEDPAANRAPILASEAVAWAARRDASGD
jgi:tRNA nucleotidyltransferase (CCA-adding enzyme)